MNEKEELKESEIEPIKEETAGLASAEAGESPAPVPPTGGRELGGEQKGPRFVSAVWAWLRAVVPGLALCVAIAVPSWFLGKLVPVIGSAVFAIVIGMVIAFFRRPQWLERGIKFSSKKILQASIVFLGFNMNFYTVVQVGKDSLLIILSTIATALIVSFVLSKLMKIPSAVGTLVGVGSSVCGGSAIAATAPVIRAKDGDVATAISVIFLFNVIAAFTFPALGTALGLSDTGFGMWAGTAVNDTSSVVAAGNSWASMHGSDVALNYATIVKLTRTLAIIPITLVLAIFVGVRAKRTANGGEASGAGFSFVKIFPWFVLFFLAAAIVNTWAFPAMGVPSGVSSFLSEAGKFMIAVAMAAIGLNTNVIKLVKSGGKPILLGFVCWVCIAGVSLGVQSALGIL